MEQKKNEKTIKVVITIAVIVLVMWFIVVNPLLKFKSMEKEVLNASKRYFEINTSMLPTGTKIRKISLQTLYDKDFIEKDLRAPYTNKYCDSENSWVRVSKEGNDYQYSVYLECGLFKSKTDHKGPEITLNGKDEVTVYQGDKYKDAGIKSVVDDTDGKMDIGKVKIDASKVNTDIVGTYEVTYTIKDSLENETLKVRTVKVIQTLNNIVNQNTDKSKIYKGNHGDNHLMLDGILFKIVGINDDNSVKIVSNEALSSVDYNGIDSWLNDYFYEKLSDSAKSYIIKSKWCNEKVLNPSTYTKCDDYSKKKYVGLLSIADYNNSKDSEGITNLNNSTAVWTLNKKTNNQSWVNSYFDVNDNNLKENKEFNNNEIYNVKPAMNIIENATVSSGDGTVSNPYILKGNSNKYKKGSKISDVKTGTYISYSGYTWRVIGKDEDDTTKVAMIEPLNGKNGNYYTKYDNELDTYNPTKNGNLGYTIVNEVSEYIKTNYFVSKKIPIKEYNNKVLYNNETSTKNYKVKLSNISVFDLYSASTSNGISTWYQETSNEKVYINSATLGIVSKKFSSDETNSIKLTGYLSKDVVIKSGTGTQTDPFTLTK